MEAGVATHGWSLKEITTPDGKHRTSRMLNKIRRYAPEHVTVESVEAATAYPPEARPVWATAPCFLRTVPLSFSNATCAVAFLMVLDECISMRWICVWRVSLVVDRQNRLARRADRTEIEHMQRRHPDHPVDPFGNDRETALGLQPKADLLRTPSFRPHPPSDPATDTTCQFARLVPDLLLSDLAPSAALAENGSPAVLRSEPVPG